MPKTKPKPKTTGRKRHAPTRAGASAPTGLYCALVLDESGSMGHLREATINGANAWIADQRRDGPDDLLTLVMFDDRGVGESVRVRRDAAPLRTVDELTLADYAPGGGTPLYDAIGFTIARIEADPRAVGRKVVVVVMTDGLENASREYSRADIAEKVAQKEAEGWTVLYLGANQDAPAVAAMIGISPTMASTYHATNVGATAMYALTSNATRAVRYGASAKAVSGLVCASASGSPVRSLTAEDIAALDRAAR